MDNESYSTALKHDLDRVYGLQLPEKFTKEQLETLLAARINQLIRDDFDGLIQLLYRIDIHEGRLRQLLKEGSPEDTGTVIARLIIERQIQKIETRRQYKPTDSPTEEEKW